MQGGKPFGSTKTMGGLSVPSSIPFTRNTPMSGSLPFQASGNVSGHFPSTRGNNTPSGFHFPMETPRL